MNTQRNIISLLTKSRGVPFFIFLSTFVQAQYKENQNTLIQFASLGYNIISEVICDKIYLIKFILEYLILNW